MSDYSFGKITWVPPAIEAVWSGKWPGPIIESYNEPLLFELFESFLLS
jgi:hypothetical protein